MRVHHIGYLVKRMELAKQQFQMLGYIETGRAGYDACRDAYIVFMEKDGYCIELVCPKSNNSVVSGLIKRYRNTPYHICYEADDFEAGLSLLEANGFTRIDEPCPAPVIDGCRVCFFMGSGIGMIEILEKEQAS